MDQQTNESRIHSNTVMICESMQRPAVSVASVWRVMAAVVFFTTTIAFAQGQGSATSPAAAPEGQINFFSLLVQGGAFMIPIVILSVVAVTAGLERFIALRMARILPQRLVAAMGQLGASPSGFDPRQAYKICQQFPSSASTVIKSMLSRVGRPHNEVERNVQDSSQREAERLYSNVRFLNLAAAVAPLLGLLGTVWGMIVAFHDTTILAPGQNKAEFLAEGIYIALVTTLAGLLVAIPSAIVAHYFEGRIQSSFHQIGDLVDSLLPQVERFEGRVRFSKQSPDGETNGRSTEGPPVVASTPARNEREG